MVNEDDKEFEGVAGVNRIYKRVVCETTAAEYYALAKTKTNTWYENLVWIVTDVVKGIRSSSFTDFIKIFFICLLAAMWVLVAVSYMIIKGIYGIFLTIMFLIVMLTIGSLSGIILSMYPEDQRWY